MHKVLRFLPISSVLALSSVSKPLHRVLSSLDFDVSFWQYAYKRATKKPCALRPFLALPSPKETTPIELGLCVSNSLSRTNGTNGFSGFNGFNGFNGLNGFNSSKRSNRSHSSSGRQLVHGSSGSARSRDSRGPSGPSGPSGSKGRKSPASPHLLNSPNSPHSPSGVFQSEFLVVYNTHCFRWRLLYLQDVELPRCVEDAFPLLLHPLVSQPPSLELRSLCESRRCVGSAWKRRAKTISW